MGALDTMYAGPGGAGDSSGGGRTAGIGAELDLTLTLGRIAAALEQQRLYDQRCAEAIRSAPIQPHQLTVSGTFVIAAADNTLGPNTGYAWAVQRVTIAGLTPGLSGGSPSTPDLAAIYRGPATSVTIADNNLLQVVSGNTPTWHPGRTGLILQPGDTLLAANVEGQEVTTTSVTLTGEVIIMELWLLPSFLL